MISYAFRSTLQEAAFAQYNYYGLGYPIKAPFLIRKDRPGPLPIFHIHNDTYNDAIPLYIGEQFKGRTITKPRFKEVFTSSPGPIILKYGERHYYVANGFIAEHDPADVTKVKELVVACSSKRVGIIDSKSITIFISNELRTNEDYKMIKAIVDEVIRDHPGDIIYTSTPILESMITKIPIPKFAMAFQEVEYKKNMIKDIGTQLINSFTPREVWSFI